MVTVYTEINLKDIVFSPLHDNAYIPSQRISWISKVDKSKLVIQTPYTITETYGIAKESIFYNTDKSRAFYKMPLCHERKQHADEIDYDKISDFYNKMKELDEYFASDEFKKKDIWG